MSRSPLNLPTWLWLLLALGVFGGQWHQLTCRTSGHSDPASVHAFDHHDADHPSLGDPASGHHHVDGNGNGGCAFHCQFSASIPCGLTPYARPVLAFSVTVRSERADPAPESRLVAIEHPPQLA